MSLILLCRICILIQYCTYKAQTSLNILDVDAEDLAINPDGPLGSQEINSSAQFNLWLKQEDISDIFFYFILLLLLLYHLFWMMEILQVQTRKKSGVWGWTQNADRAQELEDYKIYLFYTKPNADVAT